MAASEAEYNKLLKLFYIIFFKLKKNLFENKKFTIFVKLFLFLPKPFKISQRN